MKPLFWRVPDNQVMQIWAVWYGPAGPEGDCATEVERISEGLYEVSEYTCVVGLIDNPPAPILKTTTVIEAPDLLVAPSIGTQYLAYYGGEETWVNELP